MASLNIKFPTLWLCMAIKIFTPKTPYFLIHKDTITHAWRKTNVQGPIFMILDPSRRMKGQIKGSRVTYTH